MVLKFVVMAGNPCAEEEPYCSVCYPVSPCAGQGKLVSNNGFHKSQSKTLFSELSSAVKCSLLGFWYKRVWGNGVASLSYANR